MKGDDIADRLLHFAVGVIGVVGEMSTSSAGKHVARQLTRAGTSGGANYEEARAAESRADFTHKVSVAAKEVGESVYWLQVVKFARLADDEERLTDLVDEGRQLTAILKSSARTAKSRAAERSRSHSR